MDLGVLGHVEESPAQRGGRGLGAGHKQIQNADNHVFLVKSIVGLALILPNNKMVQKCGSVCVCFLNEDGDGYINVAWRSAVTHLLNLLQVTVDVVPGVRGIPVFPVLLQFYFYEVYYFFPDIGHSVMWPWYESHQQREGVVELWSRQQP